MNTQIEILFAHNDEPLPTDFQWYPKRPAEPLSDRQLRKWKSRRLAHFLLHQCAEKYPLDRTLFTDIARTPSGRPYVADDRIDFNISHSGDWVALIFAFSPQGKKWVGIDLEHPQKTRRYADLLRYYAPPEEIADIADHRLLPQLSTLSQRFYLSWCLREAILKAQGVGIVKLSEVQHSLRQQTIQSVHCPSGTLCFYHQLPFYLAYFFEQSPTMLSLPPLFQWENGQRRAIHASPLVYQVN